jgi:AraC-like DNA-binding protein
MEKRESIEGFYKRKLGWVPDTYQKQIGHFNIFPLEPFVGKNAKPVPYVKRDYFKIMLCIGHCQFVYADQVLEVEQQALVFSNPHIPYKVRHLGEVSGGFFCIFNADFFQQYGNLNQYSLFHPQGNHVFELSDDDIKNVSSVYEKMFVEINSSYVHKYDVLRNLAFELIHFALKKEPSLQIQNRQLNASQRISTMFLELLERQFPIDDNHTSITYRTASEFAKQLNVHVNHLNRALKETTQRTTSQIISERILQEAKILLEHSTWNVTDIAFALGFAEATHFSNFFKKHTQISPSTYRKSL